MRRNVKLFSAAFTLVILILSISGITLSKLEKNEEESRNPNKAALEIFYRQDENQEKEKIQRGEWYKESVSVKNRSDTPLYVRVKLQVSEFKEKNIFRVGKKHGNQFSPLNFDSAEQAGKDEYWVREGDYLYYRNKKTKDMLKPEKETAPIYEAVQLHEALDWQDFSSIKEASLIIIAESAEMPWQNFEDELQRNKK